MSTNVGSLSATLAMGYDPSGLKLFKSDIAAAKQTSVNMIAGMSAAANNLDPMMAKLSRSIRDVAAAEEAAFKASVAARHAGLNGGSSGSQDFTKLETSLRIQADREYWTEHARLRDQQIAEDAQAWRVAEAKRAATEKPTTPSFGAMMASTQNSIGYKDPMIEALSQFQKNGGAMGAGGGSGPVIGGGKPFNGAMMAQQLGFGMQDFMSQVQNSKNTVDGLGRGIMAVSNNVQMLGAAFGPTGLAMTAIGGSLAGIILPGMIKWAFQTKDLAEQAKEARNHVEAIAKLSHSVIEIKIRGGAADKVNELEEQKALAMASRADLENRKKTAQDEERGANARIREMKEAGASERDGPITNQDQVNKNKALRDQITLRAQAKEQADALGKLEDEQTKKINEANVALKAIKPNADVEKQLEAQRKIAKFKSEQDVHAVMKNHDQLIETRNSLADEISIREKAAEKLSGQEHEIAMKRLEEIKQQRDLNEDVITAVTPHMEKKRDALLKNENRETDAEYQSKAQDEITKIRLRGLEEYGSEHSKMIAKQKRERLELENATMGAVGREEALRKQKDQQAIDLQKVKIEDREKYLASLGQDAKPSAGVDLASSEGISAINRAISGAGEHTIAKQQLEVEKKQLLMLETLAGMKPDIADAGLAMMNGKPELGGAVAMDALPMVAGGLPKPPKNWDEIMDGVRSRDAIRGVLEKKRDGELDASAVANNRMDTVIGEKRKREGSRTSDMQAVLEAKRQRESEIAGGDKGVQALLDIKKAAEETARKSPFKVVPLSG